MRNNGRQAGFGVIGTMNRKPLKHRVTLARVARESNVSVTTASLILSGRPECLAQFQQQTIDRVRHHAKELGYCANLFASSLLAERSSFFALVIQGGHTEDLRGWQYGAYESELLYGVTEHAPPDTYPVVATSGPKISEARVHSIERIMAGGVFGTIVRTPEPLLEKSLRERIKRGYPTVVVFPDQLDDWPENAIDVDNFAVGQVAGKLLAARGCKRWLVLRDAEYHAGQRLRQEGNRDVAQRQGASWDVLELPVGSESPELDRMVATRMREDRPDGMFAMTLRAAAATVAACRELGIVMGSDLALVGCDVAYRFQAPDPSITSVDVSWFEAGGEAMRRLVKMTESGESRFKTVLLPPRIIEGQTCPVPPGGIE